MMERSILESSPEKNGHSVNIKRIMTTQDKEVSSLLLCSNCKNLPLSPKICSKCSNLFCSDCTRMNCINCEKPTDFINLPQIALGMFSNISISCRNKPFGCPEILPYSKIKAHEQSCRFNIIYCENCDIPLNRREQNVHHDCISHLKEVNKELSLEIQRLNKVVQEKDAIIIQKDNQILELKAKRKRNRKVDEKLKEKQKVIELLENNANQLANAVREKYKKQNQEMKEALESKQKQIEELSHFKINALDKINEATMSKQIINEKQQQIVAMEEQIMGLSEIKQKFEEISISMFHTQKATFLGGDFDGNLYLFNSLAKASLVQSHAHKSIIKSILCFKSGKFITSSCDCTIRQWDSNFTNCLGSMIGHEDTVTDLAYINKTTIGSCGEDQRVQIWNFPKQTLLLTFKEHTQPILCLCMCNERLMSGSMDGTVKVWDLEHRVCERTINTGGIVNSVLSLADGRLGASIKQGDVQLYDFRSNKVQRIRTSVENNNWSNTLIHLPLNRLCFANSSHELEIYDMRMNLLDYKLCGHSDCIYSIASPKAIGIGNDLDDSLVVSSGADKQIKFWSIKKEEVIHEVETPGTVYCLSKL